MAEACLSDTTHTATLLDCTTTRTLHAWIERFCQPEWRDCHLQGWLFEGTAARKQAEHTLAAAGVHAQLHSAYKPLVQYFLEHVDCAQVQRAQIDYPIPASGTAQRFALEAYPLAAMLPTGALQLSARSDAQPWYGLRLQMRDGRHVEQHVWAPNRTHTDVTGAPVLSPTGWLRIGRTPGAGDVLDEAVCTDYEEVFALALQAVRKHPWPRTEPFFERLELHVDLPGYEQAISGTDETISTAEALHEDLYFALLEYFQQRSGRPVGDRRLQPGQIVPNVRIAHGAPHIRVQLRPFDATAQDARIAPAWPQTNTALHALDSAPAPEFIRQTMHSWNAERFDAPTRQGRSVWGQYRRGSQRAVLISAGQHANETSGVVGALRAAEQLQTQPDAHFALIALENPDGYALHRELCLQHPQHMHHAARYTALGDDVEYRSAPPWLEREARQSALALSGARLHINLHGYPAHEWTRPLSGYVPRGFEAWMLPKGFFLILRYHAGWQEPARALLQTVCTALREVPGLAELNQRQQAVYTQHAGPLPFATLHGIAYTEAQTTHDAPVTLITEFPDETIYGPAFRFAHTVQMHTVLAAQRAWQAIALPD